MRDVYDDKKFFKNVFFVKKSASNRFSSLSIVAASIMGKDCKTTEHDDQMTTTTPVGVCVAFVIKLSVVLLIMALLSHLT